MRVLILLVCLVVCCFAQGPQPCDSPPQLSGSFIMASQNDKLAAFANYTYDAQQKRIRLQGVGTYNNETFDLNVLLLYNQVPGIMYKINSNQTCFKKRLDTTFHPLNVPSNASFVGQAVVGSSSGPGEGVKVNTWAGEVHNRNKTVIYLRIVTDIGCIPVTSLSYTLNDEWVVTSFLDNIVGISNPQDLIPPTFCEDAPQEEETEEELVSGSFSFFRGRFP